MKRLFIVSALILLFAANIEAQVGLGARGLFGTDGNAYGGVEFSIQKLGKYELDIGTMNDSWKATGLKLFPFVKRRNFGIYGGGGIGIGYYEPQDDIFGSLALNLGSYIMVGRVQLGLDWRPEWSFSYPYERSLGFNTALSARWVFGRKDKN
ncbi:hypothetical protein ACFLQX_03220 [Bacteroidota bacterium]